MSEHKSEREDLRERIFALYEKTVAKDAAYQVSKPDVLKHIDAHLDKIFRPLFT